MIKTVTIHCPYCEVLVQAQEKCSAIYDGGDYECSESYMVADCPICFNVLIGRKSVVFDDFEQTFVWKSVADRLWPEPLLNELPKEIPLKAKNDLIDAKKCFAYEVYSASAVLCGRALERLIVEKTTKKSIFNGLKDLKEANIIDQRLYDWGEALRCERNIGAHASEVDITKENARDVMNFTIAIFDYVYRLANKYDSYMARKHKDG